MPKSTCGTTTTTVTSSHGSWGCPRRQGVRTQRSSISPQRIPYPFLEPPAASPVPRTAQRAVPKSSSMPDPVRLGQSGGSRPHRPAPLCVSSQADYCLRANILIEGSRQARALSIPSHPSCHLPPSWRFWGSAQVLGAQDGAGSWVQTRSLKVQWDPMGLGYPGKGAFPLPADALLPSSQPEVLGASSQPYLASFLRQKGHTKKPITQPSAPKRGRKSPEQVWALGRNAA